MRVLSKAGTTLQAGEELAAQATTRSSNASTCGFPGGFTVLMAVYGRTDSRLFERALASVYGNTLAPDDFVLVVDGPVPQSITELISIYQDHRGLRVLWLPRNLGLAHALNQGLAVVKTAWVVRADADDMNMPDRFAKQALAVRRLGGDVDVLGGWIEEVDSANSVLAIRSVPTDHEEIVRRLRTRNPFNHMTVACRTERLVKIGGYPDLHLREDYGLWASLIADGARCHNLADVLVRATTGAEMYERRGGLRYAQSEWSLQMHLIKTGHTNVASAIVCASLRAFVFSLPTSFRSWVYERLLRIRPTSEQERPGATSF
jgi:glycosyltransferase involved in cell wall biosynthesis